MNELIANLNKAIEMAIDVPNCLLPEEFHSVRGYRSLRSVKRMAKIKDEVESKHKREKREKAKRIAAYAANLAQGKEIEYIADEERLYNNQINFCNAMVKVGLLEADDFIEEQYMVEYTVYYYVSLIRESTGSSITTWHKVRCNSEQHLAQLVSEQLYRLRLDYPAWQIEIPLECTKELYEQAMSGLPVS